MIRTLLDKFLALLRLNFRICLKEDTRSPTPPTLTCNNWTFKFYWLIFITLILTVSTSVSQLKLRKKLMKIRILMTIWSLKIIFFSHFVKEISVTKYGSNKELIPTSWNEIYQYVVNDISTLIACKTFS